MLTVGELASIRETESLLLTDSFSVSRPVRVSDGNGGWTTSGSTIGTVDGRMRTAFDYEVTRAQQRQYRISNVLVTLPGADILRGDTLNSKYEVQAIRLPSMDGLHLLVDCWEFQ